MEIKNKKANSIIRLFLEYLIGLSAAIIFLIIVISKKNIYETVWDDIYAYDNDTINTHISNI